MKKVLSIVSVLLCINCYCYAHKDTLRVSTSFTTHVIFPTELTYADLSNKTIVVAKIIEQNKNMLALKAKLEFDDLTSISALESNGQMHTFIVSYEPYPKLLVLDLRDSDMNPNNVSLSRRADAPLLSDMVESKQRLYHLGARKYDIMVLCENIVSYSDMTYITLSLENKSSVSYNITDATFVIESKRKGKRSVVFEKTIFAKNRYGTLSTSAKDTQRIAYSFDKMTLSEDQVLKVYLYEEGGQRNLEMTIDTKDINKAADSL